MASAPDSLRGPDDLGDVEVGAHRVAALADQVRLVGLDPVDRVAVLVGKTATVCATELVGGAEGADGDLTAVGDQDLGEHAENLSSGSGVPRTRPRQTRPRPRSGQREPYGDLTGDRLHRRLEVELGLAGPTGGVHGEGGLHRAGLRAGTSRRGRRPRAASPGSRRRPRRSRRRAAGRRRWPRAGPADKSGCPAAGTTTDRRPGRRPARRQGRDRPGRASKSATTSSVVRLPR